MHFKASGTELELGVEYLGQFLTIFFQKVFLKAQSSWYPLVLTKCRYDEYKCVQNVNKKNNGDFIIYWGVSFSRFKVFDYE